MIKNYIDYEAYYKNQDMTWTELPHKWQEGPFLGNGFFGCTVYFSDNNKKMIVKLGHTKIYDDRECDPEKDETLIKIPRLDIGFMQLKFNKSVDKIDMRLSLSDAKLNGKLSADGKEYTFELICLNDKDCIVFNSNDFEGIEVKYVSNPAVSPRVVVLRRNGENDFADYEEPKLPSVYQKNDMFIHYQPYFNVGGYAVAYKKCENQVYISCSQSEFDNCSQTDVTDIIQDVSDNYDKYYTAHRLWWNNYFKKSFLSLNDGKYENFYNIQLYKLACASRENGMPFDTCGPWLTRDTRWPGCWWNLNVELTVSSLYASNHIDIAKCVSGALSKSIDVLINNVPEKYRTDCAALGRSTERTLFSPVTEPGNLNSYNSSREAGNLLWALYYCCIEYNMTGNRELLVNTIYPLMKRAVKYYSYFLYPDNNGILHLKATLSPEYLKSDSDDVNYDLALLRWGSKKLLFFAELLDISDEDIDLWKGILNNLTDYPATKNEGLRIAADTPYAESHRHYSHILAFYPLHILDRDNPTDRKLIEDTISFWHSKPEALLGYSQSGAASMFAMLRNGNKAYGHLENLFNGFICPNTMYHEDENPVIETPPSAATAMQEMILQSHNGYIELFPAIPDVWNHICFSEYMCEGGFSVSGEYKDGRVVWIEIKSLLGNVCLVKNNFDISQYNCSVDYILTKDKVEIHLNQGESAIIHSNCGCEIHEIEKDTVNYFGLK